MQDLLQTGAEWLGGQRSAHMARTVTYVRGGVSLQIPATAGESLNPEELEPGLAVDVRTQDYLVLAADLGALGEPAAGDRITDGGDTYEALAVAGGQCWRWSGPPGVTMRIHAKRMAAG